MSDGRQAEIDKNLEFFLRELPSIPVSERGKFALIRHESINGYYDTALDAVRAGNSLFGDKLFSPSYSALRRLVGTLIAGRG